MRHRRGAEDSEADEVGDQAPSLDVVGHGEAGKAVGAERGTVDFASDHVGLVAERGGQFAEREQRLVAIDAGRHDVLAQHIVLHGGVRADADRRAQQIPETHAGVGVPAGGLGDRVQALQRGQIEAHRRSDRARDGELRGQSDPGARLGRAGTANIEVDQVRHVAGCLRVTRRGHARETVGT